MTRTTSKRSHAEKDSVEMSLDEVVGCETCYSMKAIGILSQNHHPLSYETREDPGGEDEFLKDLGQMNRPIGSDA